MLLLRSVTASLIFHVAIWGVFRLLKIESAPHSYEPIPVETVVESSGGANGNPLSRNAGKKGRGRLKLSDLGIGWKKMGTLSVPSDVEAGDGSEGERDVDGDILPGALSDSIRTVVYNHLYERINNAIHYPNEFQDAGIEGFVNAQLYFTPLGEFQRERSQIRSGSRYLRVLILRSLRRVLADPVPPNYLRTFPNLMVKCVFHFEITRLENPMDASHDSVKDSLSRLPLAGRSLYFYRAAKVIGEWKIGPFSGYGIAPSIGIDPQWFSDGVKKLVKGKVDPLQKYRDDPEW